MESNKVLTNSQLADLLADNCVYVVDVVATTDGAESHANNAFGIRKSSYWNWESCCILLSPRFINLLFWIIYIFVIDVFLDIIMYINYSCTNTWGLWHQLTSCFIWPGWISSGSNCEPLLKREWGKEKPQPMSLEHVLLLYIEGHVTGLLARGPFTPRTSASGAVRCDGSPRASSPSHVALWSDCCCCHRVLVALHLVSHTSILPRS